MSNRRSVAVALLLVLAAGCGSAVPVNSASSPLGNGGGGLGECFFDASAADVTYGIVELDNHSAAPVTVEHVTLSSARHLQLIGALSVPIHYNSLGIDSWPPSRQNLAQPGVGWSKRVPATGSQVPPTRGRGLNFAAAHGLLRDIVLQLRPTAHRATAAGVQVTYRQDGHQYELRAADQILLRITKATGNCWPT
jgi:hypothetical protein